MEMFARKRSTTVVQRLFDRRPASRAGRRSSEGARSAALLAAAIALPAATANAQAPDTVPVPVEVVVSHIGTTETGSKPTVELRILNHGLRRVRFAVPATIDAQVRSGETISIVRLDRMADTPPDLNIASSGFARVSYGWNPNAIVPAGQATLSVPAWHSQDVIFTGHEAQNRLPHATLMQMAGRNDNAAVERRKETARRQDPAGNAFLDNLSAYEPIYVVYGPGTHTAGRVQVSLKYQLFGSRLFQPHTRSWREGMYLGFTQRMFWDTAAESLPFHNIDFQPELFYVTAPADIVDGITFSAQGGLRHESNGQDGSASRSANSVYVAPQASFALGGYDLVVAPRLTFFLGRHDDNPDLERYRGNIGLSIQIGKADGLRLSTATRYNLASGKGAFSADVSYPLPRLLAGGPDLYLFGQSFVGYGENLLDYNRRASRLRIGIALVR